MKIDGGFSGLEAAIVLIAFVVVAAVFSYTMLGAGFFATSKAQDVTHTGMKQASSGTYIDGSLYGGMSNDQLDQIMFYIAIPETGLDQDLSKMQMAYTQIDVGGASSVSMPKPMSIGAVADANHFSVSDEPGSTSGVLKAGSKTRINFKALAGPHATGTFTIEVKPQNGASYLLQRYLPEGYIGGVLK
ncbi:MAG: flagellin [Methanomicrobiales archaeon HGW-Methanomicrobiales-4]|nr:MAG: flagellin [Methanomicrobiales archaeon HGW-Methanomicrobiales-4]